MQAAGFAMLSRVVRPRLASHGVAPATSFAAICAASTLGVVVPPSLVLILFGDAMAVTGALFALFLVATTFTLAFRAFGTNHLLVVIVSSVPGGALGATLLVLAMIGTCALALVIACPRLVHLTAPDDTAIKPVMSDEAARRQLLLMTTPRDQTQ